MALSIITNTFAGNPLDRASEKRTDVAWMQARMNHPESLAVAIWNGKPLVEDGPGEKGSVRIAYLPVSLARKIAGDDQRLLFLGLWQEIAVFAIDLEETADPTDGPLSGFGRVEGPRAPAPSTPHAARA